MYFLKQNCFKLTLLFLLTLSYPTQTAYSGLFSCFGNSSVAPKEHHLKITEALEHLGTTAEENSAIIIDIDDTALFIYQGYFYANRDVLEFYQEVIHRGYTVVFLTARDIEGEERTRRALQALGYDTGYLICMPTETRKNIECEMLIGSFLSTESNRGMKMTGEWKASERKKVSKKKGHLSRDRRYTIVMTLDDKKENLQGNHTGHTVLISKPTVETA